MRRWVTKWWRRLSRPAVRRMPRGCRPAVEGLDDRCLLSHGGFFREVRLVSDQPGKALATDAHLVNAWGITASPSGPFWVSDNGTGLATLYNGQGQAQTLVVTIPTPPGMTGTAAPTGTAFNDNSSDFVVSSGGHSGAAVFLFVTEDGTISGWNPTVDPTHAVLAVNNSPAAVYKGVTLGSTAAGDFLYAANFRGGTVDQYDNAFHLVRSFTDPSLTARHFAPFDVAVVNGQLLVTFAKQDKAKHDDTKGPGNGFIDVFDLNGNMVRRLAAHGHLNSPWGLALAPPGFGNLGGDLLVGNFGDGHINAYDPTTGHFRGQLMRRPGQPLVIDGLWGLRFGNGGQAGPTSTLFFTAGPNGEQHGLFGTVTPR